MKRDDEAITASAHPDLVGKRVTKRCPEGHPFVIRVNRETDELFLGCSEFPKCKETSEIPVSLLLRLTGAAELPGME